MVVPDFTQCSRLLNLPNAKPMVNTVGANMLAGILRLASSRLATPLGVGQTSAGHVSSKLLSE